MGIGVFFGLFMILATVDLVEIIKDNMTLRRFYKLRQTLHLADVNNRKSTRHIGYGRSNVYI